MLNPSNKRKYNMKMINTPNKKYNINGNGTELLLVAKETPPHDGVLSRLVINRWLSSREKFVGFHTWDVTVSPGITFVVNRTYKGVI